MRETFTRIWRENRWKGSESVSGPGSGVKRTRHLRPALAELLMELGVRSLLDVPCGDFLWMSELDLAHIDYVGGDVVPELVEETRRRHARPGRRFEVLDLTTSPLPPADLLLCRDCLVHLSLDDALRALDNIARSDIRWLAATSFTDRGENLEVQTGRWRPLNLQLAPFSLPTPEQAIAEAPAAPGRKHGDKSLLVWPMAAVRQARAVKAP
jgi:SAM-dependent methyltransferase